MGFTLLNAVSGTVATQSNSGSASVVLGSGQGAAFATASVGSPARCVVVDTSTSPETVKFLLDVTGVTGDTLTVTNRGVTDGNLTAADANILVGYTVAAVITVGVLNGTYQALEGSLVATDPRVGMVGDGSTDNATGWANARTLLANGGELIFPPGKYMTSSFGNWDNLRAGVTFKGFGGLGGDSPSSQKLVSEVVYTGTGSATALSIKGTNGFRLQDIAFTYNSTSFTGKFIDASIGTNQSDNLTMSRSRIGCNDSIYFSTQTALCSLDLGSVVGASFDTCWFIGTQYGVNGRDGRVNAAGYSNAVTFRACHFGQAENMVVATPGEQWTFDDCWFENLRSGAPGLIGAYGSAQISSNLSIRGCQWWDSTIGGACIFFWGAGLSVIGNKFTLAGTNNLVIATNCNSLSGQCRGVTIIGNSVQGSGTGTFYTAAGGSGLVAPFTTGIFLAANTFDGAGISDNTASVLASANNSGSAFLENGSLVLGSGATANVKSAATRSYARANWR